MQISLEIPKFLRAFRVSHCSRWNQSRTEPCYTYSIYVRDYVALEIQRVEPRQALGAFPRKRFPRALFSRTSHRRPQRQTISSIRRLTSFPDHRPQSPKLSLFHSDSPHRRRRMLVIVIAVFLDVTVYALVDRRIEAAFTPFLKSSHDLFPCSFQKKRGVVLAVVSNAQSRALPKGTYIHIYTPQHYDITEISK